jgi:hypothetical protein
MFAAQKTKMSSEVNMMIDMQRLREMTSQEFCLLGAGELAYVKPIVFEDAPCFAVTAADGRQLGIAADYASAVSAIRQHELYPVSVH